MKDRQRDEVRCATIQLQNACNLQYGKFINDSKYYTKELVHKAYDAWLKEPYIINQYGIIDLNIEFTHRVSKAECIMLEGGKKFIISLPPWGRHPITMLHEFTHVLIYVKYSQNLVEPTVELHGIEFASEFLKLVKLFIGEYAYKKLQHIYKLYKVEFVDET